MLYTTGRSRVKAIQTTTLYYDMSKYVVDILGGAVFQDIQMSSREQISPKRYNDIIAGSSCRRGDSLIFLFRGSITVGRQQ